LSSLEIITKEILNTQRAMQAQQKKLQDTVEVREVKPPVFEDAQIRKSSTTPYPPPTTYPSSTTPYPPPVTAYPPITSTIPSAYYSNPPSTISSYQSSLVPVSHAPVDTTKSDAELAKRLQAEFDQEQSKQQTKQTQSVTPKPTPQPAAPKPGQTEACPICSVRVATVDIEAHVEQHFEDDAGGATKGKPGQSADKKEAAKPTPGLFSKWFTKEDEKKAETSTPTPKPDSSAQSSNSSSAVHATPASLAYPPYMSQRGGFYPGMPGQYPRGMPQGYFPTGYPPQQQQRLPSGMGQQYLYYPNLDQPPQ